MFGTDANIKYIDLNQAEKIVTKSNFVASSRKHINLFVNSPQPVFFNPTIDLLEIKGTVDNLKIVIERKDIVYYDIAFEKFF